MHPPQPTGDVAACLAGVRRGEEAAAVALVGLLQPLVMKIAQAHRPLRQAPEDLAQEVFARVFERLDRYEARPGVPFEHWVSRLAVRTCLDALRAERRRPEVRESEISSGEGAWLDHLVADASTEEPGSSADARDLVERLLSRLGAQDRLVITLLDLEERSVAEVVALTGWSGVGVRVRAFRARARLKKAAEDLGREAYP